MKNCAQCGRKFTCGCQKTTSSTGTVVCKGCKNASERSDRARRTGAPKKSIRSNEILTRRERARRY